MPKAFPSAGEQEEEAQDWNHPQWKITCNQSESMTKKNRDIGLLISMISVAKEVICPSSICCDSDLTAFIRLSDSLTFSSEV